MRVNAINLQNINFAEAGKFNRSEYKQRMRATEHLIDKSSAMLYSEFDRHTGIPFDKTIYYTSVSFPVPNSKNIATLAIEPFGDTDTKEARLLVEVEDENCEVNKSVPVLVGSKDSIVSYLNDSVNSIPHLTRTVLKASDDITE